MTVRFSVRAPEKSCLISVGSLRSECEERVAGGGWVPDGLPGGSRDVGGPGQPVDTDGKVPDHGHHVRSLAGADLTVILVNSHVSVQWSRFSTPQWPRIQAAIRSGEP